MIDKFRDKYDWASNTYMRATLIGGVSYPSTEHFFASCKTHNEEERQAIINAEDGYEAKRLGRKCTLRSDWQQTRVHIMAYGLFHKFFQHMDLRQKLLDTGETFIEEGNYWHDNIWGNCKYTHASFNLGGTVGPFQIEPCPRCVDTTGQNKLGLLLMATRKYFIAFAAIPGGAA